VTAADVANRLTDAGVDEADARELSAEQLATIAAIELRGAR
jgi:hypothetical protein